MADHLRRACDALIARIHVSRDVMISYDAAGVLVPGQVEERAVQYEGFLAAIDGKQMYFAPGVLPMFEPKGAGATSGSKKGVLKKKKAGAAKRKPGRPGNQRQLTGAGVRAQSAL